MSCSENVTSAGSTGSLRRGSGPGSYRHGPSQSSSQRSSYEERCVDPVEDRLPTPDPKTTHKAHLKDANGKEHETVGFIISASADPPAAVQTCNPCTSPGGCRTFVCSVITCGLYRVCRRSVLSPCLAPNESAPDEPEKISLRAVNPGDDREEDAADWLGDVHIAGVKVDREYLDIDPRSASDVLPPGGRTQPSHPSLQESMRFEDWEDEEENVDSLITKKLLELYSEYQIEELARCTTDSVFLRKSRAINQLINSLAEEHKMGEQEAECRLVRGIIRISTRKSSKRRRGPPVARRERTLSDSGNETMRESDSFSFSNNNDYKSNPNIQISELTSTDKYAREMWRNNGGHTSSSSTALSPSHTESSDVSLIRTSVRT